MSNKSDKAKNKINWNLSDIHDWRHLLRINWGDTTLNGKWVVVRGPWSLAHENKKSGKRSRLCEECHREDDARDGRERRRADGTGTVGLVISAASGACRARAASTRSGGGATARTLGSTSSGRRASRPRPSDGRGGASTSGGGKLGEEVARLEGDTVRGGGDARSVRHRRNGTKRLGRLREQGGHTIDSVDTGEVLVVRVTHLEDSDLGSIGASIADTDTIKTVVAVVGGVGVLGVADLHAREVGTNKAVQYVSASSS